MELIPAIVRPIIEWGIREELLHGDHTGQFLAEPDQMARAQIYMKKPGVVCGLPVAEQTFRMLDPDCRIEMKAKDGDDGEPGKVLMVVTGKAWIFSAGERLALDYLQHLSGIATKARRFAKLAEPYGVRITDARKGIPPIRVLQKYAVRTGGAFAHMYSLHNALLIKDNHIKMAGGLYKAVTKLRSKVQHSFKIEVECESLEDVREALRAGAECIMLDNMPLDMMRDAVKIIGDKAFKEATGGVDEDMIVPICQTGVDQIAIGGIVHSVTVVDISIDIGTMKASAKRDIAKEKAGAKTPRRKSK